MLIKFLCIFSNTHIFAAAILWNFKTLSYHPLESIDRRFHLNERGQVLERSTSINNDIDYWSIPHVDID